MEQQELSYAADKRIDWNKHLGKSINNGPYAHCIMT